MLDIRVRKAVEISVGKGAHLAVILLLCLAPTLLLLAAFDVYLAGLWGGLHNYSLASVFEAWIHPVEVQRHYSGFLLKAVSRLDMAYLSVLLAIVMLGAGMALRRQRWLAQNIIRELERHGAW